MIDLSDASKREAVKRMLRPFFDRGASKLFVAECCKRVFVGVAPAEKCRTCTKAVENHEVLPETEL